MNIFCFGNGYVAQQLQNSLPANMQMITTSRTPGKYANTANNIKIIDFNNSRKIAVALKTADILLSTIPPSDNQSGIDPTLDHYRTLIEQKRFLWVGYLSATSVYGHQNGDWVNENTTPLPSSAFGEMRLAAEHTWQTLNQPWHIFRISGIYGPQRSAFERLESNSARCLYKKGVVFNRIHIDDLIQLILLSMQSPTPQEIYNIADQQPCPQHEVTQFAAKLLGITSPPLESIDDENINISARMSAFFSENKRVNADKILDKLNYRLKYPSYQQGLKSILNVKN